MKIRLSVLFAFLSVPILAATLLACGDMSHDSESSSMSSSETMNAAKLPDSTPTEPLDADTEKLLAPYFSIRASLANDSTEGVTSQAEAFAAVLKDAPSKQAKNNNDMEDHKLHLSGASGKLVKKGLKIVKKVPCVGHMAGMMEEQFIGDDKSAESGSLEKLRQSAKMLSTPGFNIQETRNNFAAMSDALVSYLKENIEIKQASNLQLFHCGMANHYWLQQSGEPIGNPFFGTKMLECGEKEMFATDDGKTNGGDSKSSSGHDHN